MSKTTDILNQVTGLLKGWKPFKFETAPAPSLTVHKLKDGTEVGITKLEVGGVVTVGGAAPAAGTLTLEDGTALTVDAAGVITAVTPPAAAPAPVATPAPAQQAAQYEISEALKTAEGLRALYEKFAAGTPEERIGNLELMCKAMMEYCFGWQLREAKEKSEREQAMKVYQDNLANVAPVLEQQSKFNSQVVAFMEEVAAQATGGVPHETKKQFSFSKTEVKTKGLQKFADALKAMNEPAA